jgi:excisionase family DNA binding protein
MQHKNIALTKFFGGDQGWCMLIGTREAAARLGVSLRRVQQMIEEGTLPAEKVGRDHVIRPEDLDRVKVYGKPGRPAKASKKEG